MLTITLKPRNIVQVTRTHKICPKQIYMAKNKRDQKGYLISLDARPFLKSLKNREIAKNESADALPLLPQGYPGWGLWYSS